MARSPRSLVPWLPPLDGVTRRALAVLAVAAGVALALAASAHHAARPAHPVETRA